VFIFGKKDHNTFVRSVRGRRSYGAIIEHFFVSFVLKKEALAYLTDDAA